VSSDSFKLLKTGKTGGLLNAAVLPCLHTVNTSNQATVIKLFQADWIIREGWEDASCLKSTLLITVREEEGSTSAYFVREHYAAEHQASTPVDKNPILFISFCIKQVRTEECFFSRGRRGKTT